MRATDSSFPSVMAWLKALPARSIGDEEGAEGADGAFTEGGIDAGVVFGFFGFGAEGGRFPAAGSGAEGAVADFGCGDGDGTTGFWRVVFPHRKTSKLPMARCMGFIVAFRRSIQAG